MHTRSYLQNCPELSDCTLMGNHLWYNSRQDLFCRPPHHPPRRTSPSSQVEIKTCASALAFLDGCLVVEVPEAQLKMPRRLCCVAMAFSCPATLNGDGTVNTFTQLCLHQVQWTLAISLAQRLLLSLSDLR